LAIMPSRATLALTAALALALAAPGAVVAQVPPPDAPPRVTNSPDRPTRLFFGPTARPLRKGEGYFALHGGLIPAFQVGLTDRVSIGAGTFYFSGGNLWLTPKVQILRRRATSVSATLIAFLVPGEGSMGFAFGTLTHDTANGGLTTGVGVAYVHPWTTDQPFEHSGPLIMIGGDRQLSPRVTFLSENYLVTTTGGMLVNGLRTSWTRFSFDLGAMIFVGDGLIGGPMVNLAWKF
jgi:hypothetical protein